MNVIHLHKFEHVHTQYKVINEQFTGMAAELHFWDLLHEQAQLESNWKQEDWQLHALLSHQCLNSPI